MKTVQWNLSNTDSLGPMKCVLIEEVSSFQGANNTYLQWNLSNTDTLGPIKCVLIEEVSSFQGANNTYVFTVESL